MSLSIVIPTLGREQVLLDTVSSLLALEDKADEILLVDQTRRHEPHVEQQLQRWGDAGQIKRIARAQASIPSAMNEGLREAQGDLLLFLDDDILPGEGLISAHVQAHEQYPEAHAVAGQILQPENSFESTSDLPEIEHRFLYKDLAFPFNSTQPAWVENVMAGNLSVKRIQALRIGGFDVNYIPPVSYRFETDFAKRLVAAGGKIRFEPTASIKHLRAGRGGTRTRGGHLRSASPLHGVGDYYYALCNASGGARARYMIRRFFREVRTRFHLRHPWWIPIKLVGELRAIFMAFRLPRKQPDTPPHTQ